MLVISASVSMHDEETDEDREARVPRTNRKM